MIANTLFLYTESFTDGVSKFLASFCEKKFAFTP